MTKNFTMRKKDTKGKPVLFSKANWLNFGEGEDGGKVVKHTVKYWMKAEFSEEEPWQKVCILKGRKKLAPPTNLDPPILYPSGHGINPRKASDLQAMIPFLPLSCQNFFRSLARHLVAGDVDSDDSS